MTIIKRSGMEDIFDIRKIEQAIREANEEETKSSEKEMEMLILQMIESELLDSDEEAFDKMFSFLKRMKKRNKIKDNKKNIVSIINKSKWGQLLGKFIYDISKGVIIKILIEIIVTTIHAREDVQYEYAI